MFPLAVPVGQKSGLLLDTVDFESDWLLQPMVAWSRSDDYKKALEYVSNVKVVNDIEGLTVKIITIFVNVIATDFQQMIFIH